MMDESISFEPGGTKFFFRETILSAKEIDGQRYGMNEYIIIWFNFELKAGNLSAPFPMANFDLTLIKI